MRGKILLVDDNKDLLVDFKLWFEEYDITGADCAAQALALLAKPNEFDLVILDVQMPGMDGLAALDKIKAAAPGMRVIIMTAYSTKDVAIHALNGRADNYVEKPFELKTMRAAIEKELLARHGSVSPGDMDAAGKIAHVSRFLESNCFKKVTLKDAAGVVFLTPKYLSRLFMQQAGMSFSHFKLKVKMDQAGQLLRSTGLTVKQISAKLGYANAESFIRQFEKIVKATPSCYRKTRKC